LLRQPLWLAKTWIWCQIEQMSGALGFVWCHVELAHARTLVLLPVLVVRSASSLNLLLLENLTLRQQLGVLKRRRPQPRFAASEKLFWVILRRLWRGIRAGDKPKSPGRSPGFAGVAVEV
jgi:hypothetical protein